MNRTASGIKFARATGTSPDCDPDVQRKRRADKDVDQSLQIHVVSLIFVNVEFAIDFTHLFRVVENQRNKHVNRTLLGKPESQWVAPQLDVIQHFDKQDAGAERNQKPYDHDLGQ
jgi:hypothetical protein